MDNKNCYSPQNTPGSKNTTYKTMQTSKRILHGGNNTLVIIGFRRDQFWGLKNTLKLKAFQSLKNGRD